MRLVPVSFHHRLLKVLLMSLATRADAQTATPTPTPTAPPLFSEVERAQVVGFWNASERYEIAARADAQNDGQWTVRLTPEASRWFHAYGRVLKGGKVPPTQTAVASGARGERWEAWIAAKLNHDRAQAQQLAARLNGTGDATNAASHPDAVHPGVIPSDLLAAAGNPPPLAAAVAPRRYTVRFDDGETFAYTDHVNLGPRYAYYRFAQGVSDGGTPLRRLPPQELDALFAQTSLSATEQRVMKAVSRLEGGFDAVNTYDTGYVSVGFIQFAALEDGIGSLGPVLRREKNDRPDDFQNDFRRYGVDVARNGALVVVDPATGAELSGLAAALKIIDDKRLIAVFARAGRRAPFRTAQILSAMRQFYPTDDTLKVTLGDQTLTGKVSDVIRSEAGIATLFDRKVNTGNIRLLPEVLSRVMTARGLVKLEDAARHEREIIAAMKWRVDFLQDKTLSQPQP